MIAGYDDDDENLSDEDYLISQARKYLSLDRATAKSWMIAAKSVFPTSFNIQYESYQMARQCGNVQEAAEDFHELIKVFPNERVLWHEMQKIADFLRSDVCTEDASFYRALFNDLSSDVQHDMLVSVADHCEDTMEHCRIILLLLQKFPNKALQHGVKLIDTLFAAEKRSRYSLPVNQYRRLLVCDVLPLIFVSPSVILPTKTMFRLLLKAIEFYICYITLPANTEAEQAFKSENLLNDPWQQLFQFLKLAGHKLEWDMVDIFSTVGDLSLSELNWQKMWAVLHKKQSYSEPTDMSMASGSSTSAEDTMTLHVKEVFFCTVVMYFHSLYQFGKLICPEWFSGSNAADTHYILIEGIQSKEDHDQLKSRKRRVDGEMKDSESILQLTVSKSASPEVANTLTQSFVMAIKCWDILHNNSLRKEFNRLSQHLRMEEWPWFQEFFIDSIIYQGYHKDAVSKLIHILGSATDEFTKNKASLQLASCSYYVGDFYKACKYLFDVICTFTQPFASSCSTVHYDAQPKRTGHHMHFIAFKHAEVLQYCVKLLITVFKEKALRSTAKDCMCLGHLLVLLQYDWPQEENLFLKCIDVIKKEGSFCYGLFFNYIVKSDMLEEFMFLTTPAGGTISLDLLPTSTVQIGKQRAVTRGVNKGAKEDLRGNMEKQMARCDEDLNNLLVTFIKQERDLLMQNIV